MNKLEKEQQTHATSESTLIDYFVVCGLDKKYGLEQNDLQAYDECTSTLRHPLKRSYKCRVLEYFPRDNAFDEEPVKKLCLPRGLLFEKQEHKAQFHPFIITREDGSRTYGAALTFYEKINDESICSAMQSLQTMFDAEYRNQNTSNTQFNMHRDELYATKCICLLSQLPFNGSFKKILQILYDMVKNQDLLGISLESHLYNLLFKIPMPIEGDLIKFHVGCKSMFLYLPNTDELPLFEYDLFELFSLVTIDNILNLYATCLLEQQVLLYSRDYYRLMLVAECLNCLFFPFTWLKPYVPIVPASNLHFMEAPVPYIMGFHHEDLDREAFKSGQRCFYDIDNDQLTLPEGLPELPDKQNLKQDIIYLIKYFSKRNSNVSDSGNEEPDLIEDEDHVDSSNSKILENSQAFVRIRELASKFAPISARDGSKNQFTNQELLTFQFNHVIRELFVQKFVNMFASYEKFVMFPLNYDEKWWHNREHTTNFDSKMFLIEQPSPYLPFLSHFVETQMFVSYIDLKIMQSDDKCIKLFDDKIASLNRESSATSLNIDFDFKSESYLKKIGFEIRQKMSKKCINVPLAHKIESKISYNSKFLFENIDDSFLKGEFNTKRTKIYQNKRETFKQNHISVSLDKPLKEKKTRRNSNVPLNDIDGNVELNPLYQSLLKECKLKTKRMLVHKIPEAVHLGHGESKLSGIEENMLIASLCDLIERIWGHGLQSKPGKSPLWNHLINYKKLVMHLQSSKETENQERPLVQTLNRRQRTSINIPLSQQHASPCASPIRGNHHRTSSSNARVVNEIHAKNDLLNDLNTIDKLTEVKTEIGLARAFVRLSLEKKMLGEHLRQLLNKSDLLRALYKRHAFLRLEDEREQFIYHLKSLNVVDYFCFTNYFRSLPTKYSILLVPSKKFNASSTSANVYIRLFGSLSDSIMFNVPRGINEFVISCDHNLGPLTTLIIGHDNAGMTPKWMIDFVIVRNEITGHIHRFPCRRWLGKGVDDDSLERLLISEPIRYNDSFDILNVLYQNNVSSPKLSRSTELKLTTNEIQEMLGNSMNVLVKYFERPSNQRVTLVQLLCGENGLVECLWYLFQHGFRSQKFFKKLFIWDFLEKVVQELEITTNLNLNDKKMEKFIKLVKIINAKRINFGKDGKFQIFICLACKESLLVEIYLLISKTQTCSQMYEDSSFFRNLDLLKFTIEILKLTRQFDFKLENSLINGIVL